MHSKDDPRLFRFLDFIYYSLEVLNVQYNDLNGILIKLKPSDSKEIIHALAISWSIIDSIHRIREVAQNIPGLSSKTPQLKSFLDETKIVEVYRDYIQHLRNELSKIELDPFPVWGNFSWIDNEDKITCHTAFTGSVVGNVGFGTCVYDRYEKKWVSKTVICIKKCVFNIDPCYESAKKFCQFAYNRIKELKADQIKVRQGIPVISLQFEIRE